MSDLTVIVNLLLSFVLGSIIGWLRERHGKSAGLRTHILVSVGATLLALVSADMVFKSGIADPGRISAGIVTGIGFIGAGCIVQAKGSVRGITTASSIWIVAAIGIACGTSFYVGAVATTIITVITLELLQRAEKLIIKSKETEE